MFIRLVKKRRIFVANQAAGTGLTFYDFEERTMLPGVPDWRFTTSTRKIFRLSELTDSTGIV
jgi:hypothetical protein